MGVTLLNQDVSELDLPQPVELITMNFNTINYLVEVKRVQSALKQLSINLTYSGHLIFDNHFPGGELLPSLRQVIRLPGVRGEWDIMPLPSRRGATVRMHTCLRGADRGWTCACEVHHQRWWSLSALERWLGAAGCRVIGVNSLLDERRVGSSGRWIQIVARRC
jgi:hypothetical protein